MNPHLQAILGFFRQNKKFTAEEKKIISKSLEDIDEEIKMLHCELEIKNKQLEIESSLERVRIIAMDMEKPDDLLSICEILYKELKGLGFDEIRNSQIIICDDEKKSCLNYHFSDYSGGSITEILYNGHPTLEALINQIRKTNNAFGEIAITANELNDWKQFAGTNAELPDAGLENIKSLYYYFYSTGTGAVGISTFAPNTHENTETLKRFRNVFDLAHRRYIDIREAEAQAREAYIELALERVRTTATAMQKSKDLALAVSTIFEQLEILHLEIIRCGIAIHNKANDTADLWTTTISDKGRIAQVSGDEPMDIHPMLRGAYNAWMQHHDYTYTLEGEDLVEFYKALKSTNFKLPVSQSVETNTQGLKQYLYVAHFPAGGLYAFRQTPFPEEAKLVIRRFAHAFNLAYTRFNDLRQAEHLALQAQSDLENLKAEKKKTEQALAELKTAQRQLIQSEKMASLGELTAGIAHEIQNPLNFVNNFSDVNTELIEELKNVLKEGDTDEIRALANDIKANEEKINHHGKRADAIVKGMLQHSRSSSAVKEPVDINILTDEYVRLAYHGLRAKDKSFNATINTDYDEGIGCVNIIRQDIGRVILNLITNAFYAVTEKKKISDVDYDPTVSVSTKKITTPDGNRVELSVKDNGIGIPKKALDKIFQPFFTTKPTGEGTGLGLSLSYDIIKTHGGEITVETTEGVGSEFIIKLPVQ